MFRETEEKNISFHSFAYFSLNCVPFLRFSFILFDFRPFYSSFLPCIRFVYLFRVSYLLNEVAGSRDLLAIFFMNRTHLINRLNSFAQRFVSAEIIRILSSKNSTPRIVSHRGVTNISANMNLFFQERR